MKRLSILKTQDAVIAEKIRALKKELSEIRGHSSRNDRDPALLICDKHPFVDYHWHRFSCTGKFMEAVNIGATEKQVSVERDLYKCTTCGTERIWG